MAAAEDVVATEVQSSVRDDLLAAVKEVESKQEPETTEPAEKAEKAASPERARDEAGRFAAKEQKEPEAPKPEPKEPAAAAASVATAPSNKGAAEPATQQAPEANAAPQSWSYAAKAKWAELPAEIRSEIAKRESDIHRGMTRMDDERKFARDMYQSVSPYVAMFRADGVSAPQAVANVMNIAYQLRTGDPTAKARMLGEVARQFNVDLRLLAPAQEQQGQVAPELQALRQQLSAQEQSLAQMRQQSEQAVQDAQARQAQEVQQKIAAFASDPKHKHFAAVEQHMAALITGGLTQDLEEAYQMAIHARPDIRALIQAEEKANRDAEAEKQRKAQEARNKGKSVRGGPGGSLPAAPNPSASVREDIEAAFAEARGRL